MKWYDPDESDDMPIEVQAMISNYNNLTLEAKLKVMDILKTALAIEIEMAEMRQT